MKKNEQRKCQNCNELFPPDPRNINKQEYCRKPECRKASKAASQKKWLTKLENQGYFSGPDNVERVQKWRKKNPGYSRRKKPSIALQDHLPLQPAENKEDISIQSSYALQDHLTVQPAVIIGLISSFIGSTLQDDIARTLLRMEQFGQEVLLFLPQNKGDKHDCKRTGSEK
ncbi:hypothetical protein HRM2_44290 [Desulforapulum autotrophicum HRM2]|uniref:Uncharacterized protein n=1 Tax=Desulforapulum autotrophicum (strain ATCC 43914 / DSM 3382 / VKM B-1955 / HRM2) TaxID=177437 RepID=C0QEY4_DESAH|nr:hypothetical protein [Desulforapulum autotrophicum]ACN17485.1 hypothetical protein HRM2_44290 [Desulforapulum autotrophicum HRM2]